MNPDMNWSRFTVSQARELADRAHQPRQVCEDHFFQLAKVFIQQQASSGRYHCDYNVPGFTLGLPLYNAQEIAQGLERRFRREGWTAKASGTRLRVEWASAYKPVLKSVDGFKSRWGR